MIRPWPVQVLSVFVCGVVLCDIFHKMSAVDPDSSLHRLACVVSPWLYVCSRDALVKHLKKRKAGDNEEDDLLIVVNAANNNIDAVADAGCTKKEVSQHIKLDLLDNYLQPIFSSLAIVLPIANEIHTSKKKNHISNCMHAYMYMYMYMYICV